MTRAPHRALKLTGVLFLLSMGLAHPPGVLAHTVFASPPLSSLDTVPAEGVSQLLQDAREKAAQGELAEAGAVLTAGLQRFPDHPDLLAELAGLRFREERYQDVQSLAQRLVTVDPAHAFGWELLAAARYMEDDATGALDAWSRSRPPVVGSVSISVASPTGPLPPQVRPLQDRVVGLRPGDPLLPDGLALAQRRLASVPAVDRSRLGYRMGPEHRAELEGAVLLGSPSPFSAPESAAHLLRALTGHLSLGSSHALGQWERWELQGQMEGRQRQAHLSLEHPSHGGAGIWRWVASHHAGRFDRTDEASGSEGGVLEPGGALKTRSTRLEGRYAQWITARAHGSLGLKLDARSRGLTYWGAGGQASLIPLREWGRVSVDASGWIPIQEAGSRGDPAAPGRPYGQLGVAGLVVSSPPSFLTPLVSQLTVQASVRGISREAPPDRAPRIGRGRNVDLLMRAGSDLTSDGQVKPLFPGRAWAWGSVEAERPLGRLGPLTLGAAVFGDLVRVLTAEEIGGRPEPTRGGVHLGGGLRISTPGLPDRLRLDWAVDPSQGTSAFSAGWSPGRIALSDP